MTPRSRLYLNPIGLLSGDAASAAIESGMGRRLAGGRFAFTAVEVLRREGHAATTSMATLAEVAAMESAAERLDHLTAPRAAICGIAMDRPAIMGVINVTPDSFSDGGDFAEAESAIAQGRAMAEAGAAIIDVGGESTRPGSDPISEATEIDRVLPVVRALAGHGLTVSIDSRRASVIGAALEAGAALVNDVSALTFDDGSLGLVAASDAPVVLMHSRGDPKTMQDDPTYDCAPLDVFDELEARIDACLAAGMARARIVVDPGIGFGKSPRGHNIEILQRLGLLHGLGCPLLLGVSRKGFIDRLAGAKDPKQRLPGSLAAGLAGLDRGVQILRVHDVPETVQALAVWTAMTGAPEGQAGDNS